MKKIIYSILMLACLAIGFTSCDEEKAYPPVVLPAGLEGNGTADKPYSVPSAIMRAKENGETSTEYLFTKGYVISGSIDTSYGNATWIIADTPEGDGATMTVYRAKDFNDKKFTDADKVKVGDLIVVYAPIINFKGNTPETNGGYLYAINGEIGSDIPEGGNGGGTETPSDATPIPQGQGTLDSPYNAEQANAIAAALAEGQESAEVYIEGYVNSVKEISAQYGNATFYLANIPGGGDTLYVYRIYGWNGDKVTDEGFLKVGDRVVIKAVLMNYKGNTPETKQNTGGIISINGQTK